MHVFGSKFGTDISLFSFLVLAHFVDSFFSESPFVFGKRMPKKIAKIMSLGSEKEATKKP